MPYPESASSFMTGNAPAGANYAAPLVNFSELAQLPDQYFKGTQQRRTLNLQNAFPDGMPKDASGNIDINAVSDKLTKLGGAEYASQLMPFLIQGQMGAAGAAAINGDDTVAPPVAPRSTSVPSVSGPANITGPQRSAAPAGGPAIPGGPAGPARPAQPTLSSAGTDNNGADTVRSIMTEHAGGQDVSPIIPRVAAAFKVDPDAPLTPQQAQLIRSKIPTTITPQPTQTSATTGGGAPVTPVGGTGGNGAPAPGTSTETPAPASGIVPQPATPAPAAAQPNNIPPVPGVPAGTDPNGFANALLKRAQAIHAQAARMAAFKGGEAEATSLENQAKAFETRAQQIFDFMGTAAQPTQAQKDVNSGAESTKAAIGANVKSSETQMAGIRGAATEYETDLKPKVDIAASILSDPRVYTGTGGDLSQMINRAAAIYGPTAPAQLTEMLTKVTASSILAQINGLKTSMMEAGGAGSSAGRIFQTQVELMQKAAPALGTTLMGNRALVEMERRTGEQAVAVRNLALDYLGPPDANGVPTKHKFLDAGFDKVVASYLNRNPMFNKDELGKPTLLGAPTAPPNLKTAQDVDAWAKGMGLASGDAVRLNGRYVYYHGPAAASPGTAQAAPAPQRAAPVAPAAAAPAPRPARPQPPDMPL